MGIGAGLERSGYYHNEAAEVEKHPEKALVRAVIRICYLSPYALFTQDIPKVEFSIFVQRYPGSMAGVKTRSGSSSYVFFSGEGSKAETTNSPGACFIP